MKQEKHQVRVVTVHTLFLIALCISCMIVAHRFKQLEVVRSSISVVLSPLPYLVSLPGLIGNWASEWYQSHTELLAHNHQLQADLRLLNARLQKMQVLREENTRLRHLLGSARKLMDQVIVAELLSVDQNPYRQLIKINRGTSDGVDIGYAVIDDSGIMGQVVYVNPHTATIILISDPNHATPIQFIRNGIRSIAFGNGNTDQLEIRYLSATADIKIGDELVTSGLGGRFPADYPVATVIAIEEDLTQGLISVLAIPKARLDSSREVLVVKPRQL